jgi:transcription-repair coupling factor (superfamily II helicase)
MPLDLSIFQKAVNALYNKNIRSFTSLPGSSPALLFSLFEKNSLLLCHSEGSAGDLYADAVFWSEALGTQKPILIPPIGDPHRLTCLGKLYTPGEKRIIASVEAVFSPLWHRDRYPLLRLSRAATFDREIMIETLKGYGYHPVPLVSAQGELSIRGGIVDLFPPEQELPLRIEFFGDDIESLRFFDTDTQRTVEELKEISIGPAAEPGEGPDLMEVLGKNTFAVHEPDDIKRTFKGLAREFPEKQFVSFFSLPIKGEGFNMKMSGAGGLGLLREERSSLVELVTRIKELKNRYFIVMVCSSEGQAMRLKEVPLLRSSEALRYAKSPVITTGVLSSGFRFNTSIVISERNIFGKKPGFRPIKRSKVSRLVSSIEDFKEGDYLVHTEHGIGKFLGLKKQTIEDHVGDFIVIEYLGKDRLYVPLERIDTVQKFHAPESARPRIDKLGGKTWQRTRRKVNQKIRDMAKRLLALYARRSTTSGHVFSGDTELHKEFDGFFLYEETPDQLTSLSEIKKDMESPTPMDRLLCGDVGYGKTEVIMRACFKAVYDSKQAAILVPTTILAEQHFETFTSRFSAFPITIDYLSRFKTKGEQKKTLEALSRGDIDIVIGTHILFARNVHFFNLGLLVIDEEHKFGVTHKEKIKALKTNVDVLTLSATPIPRTLHMALSGIRAMSVIETPPEDRLAVKSIVARFNPEIIRDALQKELDRGGQAFFVHNRIQDIHRVADYLKKIVPEGKIAVAHGRMREKELEGVMRSFFRKETNILVSTAIIGAGLDIPSANTIIINRSDKFGLADLYQLRGRVGRSDIRAFSYFLIPDEDTMSEHARKKLQAIQELGYLGAGFRLALRDLEIRGSGNLLGPEQSGHIEAIGFDLYIEMLEQAVSELRGEKVSPKIEPILDLRVTAMIPEYYIENPDLRLSIYRKIATVKHGKELDRLLDELKDRFGKLPAETRTLIRVMELKVLAKQLAITRIQNTGDSVKVLFDSSTVVTPQELLSLYKKEKERLRLLPEGGIEIDLKGRPPDEVFRELNRIMEYLLPRQL